MNPGAKAKGLAAAQRLADSSDQDAETMSMDTLLPVFADAPPTPPPSDAGQDIQDEDDDTPRRPFVPSLVEKYPKGLPSITPKVRRPKLVTSPPTRPEPTTPKTLPKSSIVSSPKPSHKAMSKQNRKTGHPPSQMPRRIIVAILTVLFACVVVRFRQAGWANIGSSATTSVSSDLINYCRHASHPLSGCSIISRRNGTGSASAVYCTTPPGEEEARTDLKHSHDYSGRTSESSPSPLPFHWSAFYPGIRGLSSTPFSSPKMPADFVSLDTKSAIRTLLGWFAKHNNPMLPSSSLLLRSDEILANLLRYDEYMQCTSVPPPPIRELFRVREEYNDGLMRLLDRLDTFFLKGFASYTSLLLEVLPKFLLSFRWGDEEGWRVKGKLEEGFHVLRKWDRGEKVLLQSCAKKIRAMLSAEGEMSFVRRLDRAAWELVWLERRLRLVADEEEVPAESEDENGNKQSSSYPPPAMVKAVLDEVEKTRRNLEAWITFLRAYDYSSLVGKKNEESGDVLGLLDPILHPQRKSMRYEQQMIGIWEGEQEQDPEVSAGDVCWRVLDKVRDEARIVKDVAFV
ncbi:hypothetical protein AC578_1488 [Pseudocercospora eumusae]|uniref:Uncharacterized protein n=1 Tax=Pseudocercospora eumusae TaxID=321146 RepID=A0A139H5P3_9PEZI|nr:hypothetical protein AC578_1488 [Pseudocercospora eumusae]